ncbi:MAG TPA: tripartite tricarboxylate transporter substrate binding protein [Pseudolabrys sp.]|jgi:tripartite-type tricarboxylate transporter receptor subunit TctC
MHSSIRAVLAILALTSVAPPALAQSAYPSRSIRLIVPYPAGGATDVVARVVAEKMSESLGQPIVVDNRPGAGTMIGASTVARSSPDGYTVLIGDTGTYALNPTLYGARLTYSPLKDFAPVCRTGRVPLILAANPKTVKADTVADLIALAKKQPGTINFGAPGPGSPIHLAMELFRQRVGIELTAVPYKGGADALTDLLGGRVGLLFIDAATGLPHVKSGAIKALAVGSDKRIAAISSAPTMAEAGVANFEAWAWNGLAVPTGTPPAIVAKLSDACRKALAMPAVEKRLAELSVEAAPSSPEEFASFIKDETTKWHDVITKAGVSLQ